MVIDLQEHASPTAFRGHRRTRLPARGEELNRPGSVGGSRPWKRGWSQGERADGNRRRVGTRRRRRAGGAAGAAAAQGAGDEPRDDPADRSRGRVWGRVVMDLGEPDRCRRGCQARCHDGGSEAGPDTHRRSAQRLVVDRPLLGPDPVGMGHLLIVDAFPRRIVGWRVAANIKTEMVLDALEMARTSPTRRVRSRVLRCPTDRPTRGRYPMARASIRPGVVQSGGTAR